MREMNRATRLLATAAVAMGCAGPTASVPHMPRTGLAPTSRLVAGDEDALAAATPFEAAPETEDLSGLPAAPWSAEPLATDAAPVLVEAWARADNRASCAPIAPASLGAASGARARVSSMIEGGWAVEFDRRGMPGMTRRGATCARCGRGVFGVAGTAMVTDELPDDPSPSFADGSHVEVEPPAEGESVAAATITVRGQGCVYQVWSFLGEDHLRQLVDGLRRVEVQDAPSVATR